LSREAEEALNVRGGRAVGETGEKRNDEYGIKQVGGRYYPVIVDKEAGGYYEINNSLTGGSLSYKSAEQAEAYIGRAKAKEQG